MSDDSDMRTVELSDGLVDRVESRVGYTTFDSVNQYIEHVLEEVLFQIEAESENSALEKVDSSEVEQRLESLGYLNE